MTDFIIRLIGMSLQASVVIGVVLLLRLLFQKLNISKKYVMLLWVIPFICLILPWKITSPIGFWDSAPSEYGYESFTSSDEEEIPNDQVTDNSSGGGTVVGSDINSIVGNEGSDHTNTDEVISGGQNINNDVVSGDITNSPNTGVVGENDSVNTMTDSDHTENAADISLKQMIMIVTIVWGIVVIGLGLYSTITFCRLKKQLGTRIPMRDNIFLADDIPVPMVVGFIKPEIYIPSGIDESHLEYVIAHEQTHIRRKDTIVKVVAYCITCIHWFNPLVWLAYNLLVKDIEMACDEETILRLGQDKKKDYAFALLQLSTGKRSVFAVPLAFGEGSTKARIVNVLKYKKTKQIFAVAALVIGILLAVVFLTKDGNTLPDSSEGTEGSELVDNTEDTDASWKTMMGDDSAAVVWVDTYLNGDMSGWFTEFAGGTLQLISGEPNLGPATRTDIVYYETTETNLQSIIITMVDAMLQPLMEESDERTYTITKYRLDEHKLYQVSENAWIIQCINGYYTYEGTDIIPWGHASMNKTPDGEGMISFNRQGSDGAFAYVLIKDGNRYRLEKLSEMMSRVKGAAEENEPEKYLTLRFNDVYQAVFAGNVGELRFRNCENGRRISDSGSAANFYYVFELEYQGEEYELKTYYDGEELSLTKVTLHKPTGGRMTLYPLQYYGHSSYSLIQQWDPLEDRKEKFCNFLGLDNSVYKTDWELELEKYGGEFEAFGIWIKYVLMEKGADLSHWYQDYDGSKVQVVSRGVERAGVSTRYEIVYYQGKENESVETALEHMLSAMMEPLTKPSDDRPYTIIRYNFEEQPLIQISENIWLLRYINGYYEYEGKDLISMEEALELSPDCQREDGLIPFMRQGSYGNFVYFLIKEAGVYRLQYAGEMTTREYDAVKEIMAADSLSQEKLAWFENSFFNNEENRVPLQFLTSEYASPEEIDFYELFYNGIYDGNRPEISQEEFDFLKQRYNAMTELDVSKMTKEDIDSLVKQYMDISLEETEKIGLDKLCYLEEYDAYYNTVGDTNMRNIDILSGWNNDDGTITICYSPMNGNSPTDEVYEVTLKQGNESYCFLSNIRVDE